ncbi:hypothetical protein D7030_06385 [Flavobacteriaceae bacterium AU392]|nr:hypothetical protein D1817_02035 [Flavobacteriaceae bacterium]RKM84762.1 hypothetical protein D7030_06385 [Flavobacteriaceae bacterium AU392]
MKEQIKLHENILTVGFILLFMIIGISEVLGQSDIKENKPLINKGQIEFISENLKEYNNRNVIEKVYLHTDKNMYTPGQKLWYSGYTVLGANHKETTFSKVLYIDLINSNSEVVISQIQEIDKGKSIGSIVIPEDLISGDYQLRAYTNWMRNYDSEFFFTKQVKILNTAFTDIVDVNAIKTANTIDLQFFPEGGDLVEGLSSLVAFKAIGSDGLSREINGKILNSKGEVISIIKSIHKGSGFFYLKPNKEEYYYAELNNGIKYELPKAKKEGYVITVNNTSPSELLVRVQASKFLRDNPFSLFIGQLQKQKFYQGEFNFSEKPYIEIKISKKGLPSGVTTITLFDKKNRPMSERSLFIDNEKELIVTTQISKEEFNTRDQIDLEISVTDAEGQPISADLSLAITDSEKARKDTYASNILTQLLLESDLKGYIEAPSFYFKNKDFTTKSKLDLLMLTHGWRRFNWEDIYKKNKDTIKAFNFEEGLVLSGIAKWRNNNLLKEEEIEILVRDKDGFTQYNTKTDNEGQFKITNFNHVDTVDVVLNSRNKKGNLRSVRVYLNERKQLNVPESSFRISKKSEENKNKLYIINSKLQKEADSIFDLQFNSKKVTVLDKVVLETEIDKDEKSNPNALSSTFGIQPDAVVYTEGKEFQSFGTLLSRVGGLTVGTGNQPSVTLRRATGSSVNGGTDLLWVLDGVPIANSSIVPIEIANLSNFEIERIEIAKSASNLAIFGSRSANGAILIYTRRGDGRVRKLVSPEFRIAGYPFSKEFYAPKYNVKKEEHIKPDYRTTLYWNPNLKTNKNGKAIVTFFNSDVTNQIQIDIQGVSEGILGTYLEIFGEED